MPIGRLLRPPIGHNRSASASEADLTRPQGGLASFDHPLTRSWAKLLDVSQLVENPDLNGWPRRILRVDRPLCSCEGCHHRSLGYLGTALGSSDSPFPNSSDRRHRLVLKCCTPKLGSRRFDPGPRSINFFNNLDGSQLVRVCLASRERRRSEYCGSGESGNRRYANGRCPSLNVQNRGAACPQAAPPTDSQSATRMFEPQEVFPASTFFFDYRHDWILGSMQHAVGVRKPRPVAVPRPTESCFN